MPPEYVTVDRDVAFYDEMYDVLGFWHPQSGVSPNEYMIPYGVLDQTRVHLPAYCFTCPDGSP